MVGEDETSSIILWNKIFLGEKVYNVEQTILYQGNKSTFLLQENRKKSSSKSGRHLNVRYFFLADQFEKGKLTINYCPTETMTVNFITKTLQGGKFR